MPERRLAGQNEVVQMIKTGLARKIYFRAGDWLAMTSPPRFLWIKKHEPEFLRKNCHMTMISDWILYRLTRKFATDPSIGSSANLFQLSKRIWSDEIIDWCSLPEGVYFQT